MFFLGKLGDLIAGEEPTAGSSLLELEYLVYIPEAVCNEEGSTYLDPKTAAINYQQSKKRTYIYIYYVYKMDEKVLG